ncbi:pyridoxal phosphate-dependent aminotransferase [Cellulomonas sp. APG4]|uniref:pyridoxal phosphate-dependent aminotransferase n=1 Tax=Cellulomonas sp. APG4 TaxID=1538656 RepID=UPI0013795D9C|nr:pyridoxal phosphate-dependent aminotransferase [Cellulomonas sp. APG4]NCT91082.1 pyridoxal phosphate-dependent aminotransferase [Cellulomonas sp. APG4]
MATPSSSPEPRWRAVARGAGLVDADGGLRRTVFAEMSDLAGRTGALNLGQGFPDVDGPAHVARAAERAIREGRNQYAPGSGAPELRRAVAAHARRHYGLEVDPADEVLVTTGATEAIAAAILALVGPDDEVVVLEPYYDSYAGAVAMAGARLVPVGLRPGPEGFRLDGPALERAVTSRTRMILLNSPHNPTGAVLDEDELVVVADVARAHDLLVVTDEVYEHLTFDGVRHVPVATLPGMAERTLRISSAGKSLSFTGWKVGWLTGPADLVAAVRTVQQYLTYTSGAPFQPAVAEALADEDGRVARHLAELADGLARRRDLLCAGLERLGLGVVVPRGTYFVVTDAAPLGLHDGVALCRRMPEELGVAAVPVAAFCADGSPTARALRSHVRLTFVKRAEVLEEALVRLEGLAGLAGEAGPTDGRVIN